MTRNELFRVTVGDLARPFSIYISALGASIATVVLAVGAWHGKVELLAAAAFMTAVWAGVGALYWGKAWERKGEANASAQVEVARANSANPPATTVTAPADASVTVTPSQEAPPWER